MEWLMLVVTLLVLLVVAVRLAGKKRGARKLKKHKARNHQYAGKRDAPLLTPAYTVEDEPEIEAGLGSEAEVEFEPESTNMPILGNADNGAASSDMGMPQASITLPDGVASVDPLVLTAADEVDPEPEYDLDLTTSHFKSEAEFSEPEMLEFSVDDLIGMDDVEARLTASETRDDSELGNASDNDSNKASDIAPDNVAQAAAPDEQTDATQNTQEDASADEASQAGATDTPDEHSPFTHLRQIDYWAKLVGRERQPGTEITAWAKEIEKKLGYPFAVHGLAVPSLTWKDLTRVGAEGDEYKDIVAAIQLVDRRQAIDLDQLRRFESTLRSYARRTGREIALFAEVEQAHGQARRLEEFVKECHGAIDIAVLAQDEEGFGGDLLASSAQQQGLELYEGRFLRLKPVGSTSTVLYEVWPMDAEHFPNALTDELYYSGVKFRMIPSRTQKPGRVAKEMLDAVKAFSSRVRGTIRVPGYEEYQPEQLRTIVNGVSRLEQRMEEAGIEPGGSEAMRIFDLG